MYLAVGIGGILGSLLRFFISAWFVSIGSIPLAGTLCVNLTGCFLLGFLHGLARIYQLPNWLVIGLGTGFIGAFTTFSTFSMEVVTAIEQRNLLLSLAYFTVSSFGGYIFTHLGFGLANRKGV